MFYALTAEIEGQARQEWRDANLEKWHTVLTPMAALLAPDSYFSALGKSIQLLANHPTLVTNFKILTELRPVYDEAVKRTRAMPLTNTLVIDYLVEGQMRAIHLTVDQEDLRALREQLERAGTKNRLLVAEAEKHGSEVIVAGEERR